MRSSIDLFPGVSGRPVSATAMIEDAASDFNPPINPPIDGV
jgi:hypothetical protein